MMSARGRIAEMHNIVIVYGRDSVRGARACARAPGQARERVRVTKERRDSIFATFPVFFTSREKRFKHHEMKLCTRVRHRFSCFF